MKSHDIGRTSKELIETVESKNTEPHCDSEDLKKIWGQLSYFLICFYMQDKTFYSESVDEIKRLQKLIHKM